MCFIIVIIVMFGMCVGNMYKICAFLAERMTMTISGKGKLHSCGFND